MRREQERREKAKKRRVIRKRPRALVIV